MISREVSPQSCDPNHNPWDLVAQRACFPTCVDVLFPILCFWVFIGWLALALSCNDDEHTATQKMTKTCPFPNHKKPVNFA